MLIVHANLKCDGQWDLEQPVFLIQLWMHKIMPFFLFYDNELVNLSILKSITVRIM